MVVTKKGVFDSCKPRKEVLEGELNDAIFAAEFRYLINGTVPDRSIVIQNFFSRTQNRRKI